MCKFRSYVSVLHFTICYIIRRHCNFVWYKIKKVVNSNNILVKRTIKWYGTNFHKKLICCVHFCSYLIVMTCAENFVLHSQTPFLCWCRLLFNLSYTQGFCCFDFIFNLFPPVFTVPQLHFVFKVLDQHWIWMPSLDLVFFL